MATELATLTQTWITNFVFKGTQQSQLLSTGGLDVTPGFDGSAIESNDLPTSWTSTGGTLSNDDPLLFGPYDNGPVTGGTDTCNQLILGPSSGTLRIGIDVGPIVFDRGDYLFWDAGDIVININEIAPANFSAYALDMIADWVAGASWPAATARYAGLLTDAGAVVPVARRLDGVTDPGALHNWTGITPGTTVRYQALYDASSGGNELLRVQFDVDEVVPGSGQLNTQYLSDSSLMVTGTP